MEAASSSSLVLEFAADSHEVKPSSAETLRDSSASWLAMAVIDIDEGARQASEGGPAGIDLAMSQIKYAESKLERARRDLLEAKSLLDPRRS